MPRSATDATRFTSTTPHASKPPSAIKPETPAKVKPPGSAGETPQEKVRRLRAAADRARDAKISNFDRLIVRGRVWADKIHRFTALTLIGATVIAGGVTVYALGDMMVYNRKKKAQFFEEHKAKVEAALHTARKAIEMGNASDEQIKFVRLEDEHEAMLKAKSEKRGMFTKSKDWLFSGLKKEEEGNDLGTSENRLGYEGMSEEDDSLGARESDIVRAIEDKKTAIAEKAKQAFADERERQRSGGPLDRIGTPSESSSRREETPRSGGWTSFMIRR